jgi:hypothetical protein
MQRKHRDASPACEAKVITHPTRLGKLLRINDLPTAQTRKSPECNDIAKPQNTEDPMESMN